MTGLYSTCIDRPIQCLHRPAGVLYTWFCRPMYMSYQQVMQYHKTERCGGGGGFKQKRDKFDVVEGVIQTEGSSSTSSTSIFLYITASCIPRSYMTHYVLGLDWFNLVLDRFSKDWLQLAVIWSCNRSEPVFESLVRCCVSAAKN